MAQSAAYWKDWFVCVCACMSDMFLPGWLKSLVSMAQAGLLCLLSARKPVNRRYRLRILLFTKTTQVKHLLPQQHQHTPLSDLITEDVHNESRYLVLCFGIHTPSAHTHTYTHTPLRQGSHPSLLTDVIWRTKTFFPLIISLGGNDTIQFSNGSLHALILQEPAHSLQGTERKMRERKRGNGISKSTCLESLEGRG